MMFGSVLKHSDSFQQVKRCKTCVSGQNALLRGTEVVNPVGVLDQQPTKGSARGSECGLAEIGNSKEETRGTQFRQVRAARCVIPYVMYAV
jgi:hypothetical protein